MTSYVPFNIKLNSIGKKEYSDINLDYKEVVKNGEAINEEAFDGFNAKGTYLEDGEFKVDVDTKDINTLPDRWRDWIKDRLELKDTLIVETHKGYHIFAKSDLPVKSKQNVVNNIDIITGGTICPVEYNGKENTIFYKVITDVTEVIEVDEWDDIYDLLPLKSELTPEADDEIDIDNFYAKLSLDEVESALAFIPSYSIVDGKPETYDGLSRQDWIELMASAKNATNEDAYEVIKKWSKKDYPEFDEVEFDRQYSEIDAGGFGASISASKLIRWAINSKVNKTITRIAKANSNEDIKKVFEHKKWAEFPIIFSNDAVDKIIAAWKDRLKELKVKKLPNDDAMVDVILKEHRKQEASKIMEEHQIIVATDGKSYTVCSSEIGRISSQIQSKGKVMDYLYNQTGISKKGLREILDDMMINISETVYKADFTMKQKVKFEVKPHPTRFELDDILEVSINPFYDLESMQYDERIIKDFTEKVWGGSLDEIIKLIALTIKYEHKKNLIAIVGGASIGKSSLGVALDAPIIELTNFISAMSSTSKGISKGEIESMMRCGIVVIDECSTVLPESMKSMALGEVNLYAFGAGRFRVPLKCSILTSTHDTLSTGADKQIVDRMCLVSPDSKYSLLESPILREDDIKYKKQTQHYIKTKFKEWFDADTTLNDLIALHEKFSIKESANEIEELIYDDVVERFNNTINEQHIAYSEAQGVYGVTNKTYLRSVIKECVKNYDVFEEERVINNIVNKVIPDSNDRIRIKGKKYVKTTIGKTEESVDF